MRAGGYADSFYPATFFKTVMLLVVVSSKRHSASNYIDSCAANCTVPVLAEQAAPLVSINQNICQLISLTS